MPRISTTIRNTIRSAAWMWLLFATAPLQAAGRSVILIGWDTLRADHIGDLGYARNTTRNLDSLARRSFLFTNAISPSSWTLPTFMSIFTSLYPSEHGMTNSARLAGGGTDMEQVSLSVSVTTLAQVLKTGGYKTAAFTAGWPLLPVFGFDRGFDIFTFTDNLGSFKTTFRQALDWLKKNRGTNYFVFIHGYDTHSPPDLDLDGNYKFISREEAPSIPHIVFGAAEKDRKLLTDVYDEKISRTDALLGKFMADLTSLGGEANGPVIIFLADHGEGLYDHGNAEHGQNLYDESIHVPLLIYDPAMGSGAVNSQVSTLDVFPTILDLAGIKPGKKLERQLRGKSLVTYMKGGTDNRDAFSETEWMYRVHKRSLRKSDGMKLILDGITQNIELYDTAADPREKNDLAEKEPGKAYALEMQLLDWEEGLKPYR